MIGRHQGVLKAKIVALALLGSVVLAPSAHAQAIATDAAIVADPLTGTALMGYDVVAYFIENRAVAGEPTHQVSHAGLAWQFSSLANRIAFEEKPERFLPAFGGYDPAALSAGVLRGGDPRFFLRIREQLYLFRDPESRDRFSAHPELLEAAAREWPTLKRELVP